MEKIPFGSWNYLILLFFFIYKIESAIIPPPWSDPNKNPCASLPGGWQLLYWPPLQKCFKIFQVGYPCPDTMELVHTPNVKNKNNITAECKCPPGTAQDVITNKCYKLFERGICEKGEFFSPNPNDNNKKIQRWGSCKKAMPCDEGMIFWPKEMKCYKIFTKGPCPRGKLLAIGDNGIAECKCENVGDLAKYYYNLDHTCHEHFTQGPCQQLGELFLPDGKCGCNSNLLQYYKSNHKCYEIGTNGPCPSGHIFLIPDKLQFDERPYAKCECREGYVKWADGLCYRLYTRGPCSEDEFLISEKGCMKNPCNKGRLYFPEQKTCYRIGSQGPCSLHQVVIFDFTARPSIDGISYNGLCGCSGVITNLDQTCTSSISEIMENTCESTSDMVEINGECYKLYTRGPCGPGQWLQPLKQIFTKNKATCQCRPGYTNYESDTFSCYASSVELAKYLNERNSKSYKDNNKTIDIK